MRTEILHRLVVVTGAKPLGEGDQVRQVLLGLGDEQPEELTLVLGDHQRLPVGRKALVQRRSHTLDSTSA